MIKKVKKKGHTKIEKKKKGETKKEKKGKKNEEENLINSEMTFSEVMEKNPEAAFRLMDMGMMCGGCPIAQFETVEQGCMAHGADVGEVLKRLNEDVEEKEEKKKEK